MTVATEGEVQAYGRMGRQLLPTGALWKLNPGGVLVALLEGLGRVFADADARVRDVLEEADPRTATETLSEWEEALGLPGPCAELAPTKALRRAAIVAALVGAGGQTPAFLEALALSLGYVVELEEHQAFVAGSYAGAPLSNGPWVHTITVHGEVAAVKFLSAGSGQAGDPLVSVGNGPLECALERVAPAHALVVFVYDLPAVGYGPWTTIVPTPVEVAIGVPDLLVT